jgi:hypothetical protein
MVNGRTPVLDLCPERAVLVDDGDLMPPGPGACRHIDMEDPAGGEFELVWRLLGGLAWPCRLGGALAQDAHHIRVKEQNRGDLVGQRTRQHHARLLDDEPDLCAGREREG